MIFKDELGINSVVNAYMILASLGIGSSLTTRYGNVTRTSENDFSISFKRKPELEYKLESSYLPCIFGPII